MKSDAVEAVIGSGPALASDLAIPMQIQEWIAPDSPPDHVLSLSLTMGPSLTHVGRRGAIVVHNYSLNIRDSRHAAQAFTAAPIAFWPVENAMRKGKNALVAAILSRPAVMDILQSASPALFAKFETAGVRLPPRPDEASSSGRGSARTLAWSPADRVRTRDPVLSTRSCVVTFAPFGRIWFLRHASLRHYWCRRVH